MDMSDEVNVFTEVGDSAIPISDEARAFLAKLEWDIEHGDGEILAPLEKAYRCGWMHHVHDAWERINDVKDGSATHAMGRIEPDSDGHDWRQVTRWFPRDPIQRTAEAISRETPNRLDDGTRVRVKGGEQDGRLGVVYDQEWRESKVRLDGDVAGSWFPNEGLEVMPRTSEAIPQGSRNDHLECTGCGVWCPGTAKPEKWTEERDGVVGRMYCYECSEKKRRLEGVEAKPFDPNDWNQADVSEGELALLREVVDCARRVYRAWDKDLQYVNKMFAVGRALRALDVWPRPTSATKEGT
jgi:hypothetical protein